MNVRSQLHITGFVLFVAMAHQWCSRAEPLAGEELKHFLSCLSDVIRWTKQSLIDFSCTMGTSCATLWHIAFYVGAHPNPEHEPNGKKGYQRTLGIYPVKWYRWTTENGLIARRR